MSSFPQSVTRNPHSSQQVGLDDIHQVMEALTDGIIFLDRDWRITYANEAARKISRIEPEHILGPSHWELYPATVGTKQEEVYRTSMQDRVSLNHEFHYAPFDIWISLRTIPIAGGIAVHYRDITRIKQAEATRDDSSRQLQQVLEATSDAIVILDRNYNFTFLNRRARELLSPSGDVFGKNLWETFPGTVYPGSPYVATYRRAMDKKIPGSFEAYYGEPLNFWLTVEAQPTEDQGIILFFRDITQQRASAEALRRKTAETERQAAEIETVYRTAPIGLALFDPIEFRYLRLNDRQAQFFGLKPEQVIGRTLTEMAPIPGLRELFEQVREGHSIVNYPLEGELISHPGEHRYWTVNYAPVYASNGSVQAIAAASMEITVQKKAEQALIQNEKLAAVGRLAASISHEINNPLEAVTNLLYLATLVDDLPQQAREYVEVAQSELARVSQIATQTLRFHRQSVRPTYVTAEKLIEPVLNLYRGRLSNSEILMESRFRSTHPIHCLENEVRQVVSNLIANAIDAMRMGGRILVRSHDAIELLSDTHTQRRGVRIVVADTGHGMSAETIARIFEPFFTTKELNGTGLGLWVSADIMQRNQGSISVRSSHNPRHHGTVFSLFLPCQQEPSVPQSKTTP